MRPTAFFYSVKIWISSVLLAPVSFFVIGFIHESVDTNDLTGLIPMYMLFVFAQFVFSLITWLIFWMIIELIVNIVNGIILRKCLVSIVGVGLTIAAFRFCPFFDGNDITKGLEPLVLSNCGCIAIGSWYYNIGDRVKSKVQTLNTTEYEQATE